MIFFRMISFAYYLAVGAMTSLFSQVTFDCQSWTRKGRDLTTSNGILFSICLSNIFPIKSIYYISAYIIITLKKKKKKNWKQDQDFLFLVNYNSTEEIQCSLWFPHKNDVRFGCLQADSCLIYVICVSLLVVVSNTRLCYVFALFVFVLCTIGLSASPVGTNIFILASYTFIPLYLLTNIQI
jgi:hypothetical protein